MENPFPEISMDNDDVLVPITEVAKKPVTMVSEKIPNPHVETPNVIPITEQPVIDDNVMSES